MGGISDPEGRDPHGREPELDDETVDSRWAELTAELGALDVAAEPAAPESEGLLLPGPVPPPARTLGPRDYLADEEDEEDERYVPPEPAPLTHADPVLTLGWVATVTSLLAGLVLALVWRPLPDGVLATLGGMLLAGVALLLWRMPARRDHDDPSGCAVV